MPFLYVLTESDYDSSFYHRCIEKITKISFDLTPTITRKTGGFSEVKMYLKIFLQQMKYTGKMKDAFFLIAVDNDRSPEHPNHEKIEGLSKKESSNKCRFCYVKDKVEEIFGKEKSSWPVKGAIVIPVQMLESWLILICSSNKNENSLPLFSKKKSIIAKKYYAKQEVPNQLKELCQIEKFNLSINSKEEFYSYCIENLDLNDLATRSSSFDLFQKQIIEWM